MRFICICGWRGKREGLSSFFLYKLTEALPFLLCSTTCIPFTPSSPCLASLMHFSRLSADVTFSKRTSFVTMQTGFWPPGTLKSHDPTIYVEGNRFLLTGFHSCSELSSYMRPRTSLASPKTTSQNHTQKFPMSLSVHQLVMQTGLHPLWDVHLCVSDLPSSRSSVLLQDLGCVALGLHVAVPEQCAM